MNRFPIRTSSWQLLVTEERVESVTLRGDQIRGILRGENGGGFMTVQPTPPDASLLPTLEASGVQISVSTGKEGMFGFSKSRARLFEAQENDIGYDQVAGADSAKQELIDFLRAPERFQKLGARMPRGILLMVDYADSARPAYAQSTQNSVHGSASCRCSPMGWPHLLQLK